MHAIMLSRLATMTISPKLALVITSGDNKTGSTSAIKIEISFQYLRFYFQRESNTQCTPILM